MTVNEFIEFCEKGNFTTGQITELQMGYLSGIDFMQYAKREIPHVRMGLYRSLLETEKKKEPKEDQIYTYEQQKEIYEGFKEGLDISKYADPDLTVEQMIQIREGLKESNGRMVDIMSEIDDLWDLDGNSDRKWFYLGKYYTLAQLKQIRMGLQEKLEVDYYLNPEFDVKQMVQIRLGLLNHLDVSIYAKPEFDYLQMEMIRFGLNRELDVSTYANPNFRADQMKEIYHGLINNVDVSQYASPLYIAEDMKKVRLNLMSQHSIS